MTRNLSCILLCALLACPAMGATYYANISAVSNGDGSVGSPWKTLANVATGLDALGDDGAGDTVIFAAGNYGRLTGTFWTSAKTDWVTLQAAEGAECVFDAAGNNNYTVYLSCGSLTDVYLNIDGWIIEGGAISPMPEEDGELQYYDGASERHVVSIAKCNHIKVQNCDIRSGTYRWLWRDGMAIGDSSDVTVQHCRVHNLAYYGISIYGVCDDVSVVGNQVYDIACGGCLISSGRHTGTILWDRNHVYDCFSPYTTTGVYHAEHYLPYNITISTEYHQSSGLGVRLAQSDPTATTQWDQFIFRRNFMHDICKTRGSTISGCSQSIYWYATCGRYDNITFENNVLPPSTYQFSDMFPIALKPITFRNNTFTAARGAGVYPNTIVDVVAWWSGSFNLAKHASCEDWTGFTQSNNIYGGKLADTFPTTSEVVSTHNLIWCPYLYQYPPSWTSDGDLWGIYQVSSVNHGNPNMFDNMGFTSSTSEYNYSTNGASTTFSDRAHNDFTLSGNTFYYSGNIDPDTYGDAATQSSYSMGTMDADGWILDDGQARDADHHSIGAYEAGASFGHPTRPTLPTPFNEEFEVATDIQLAWVAGWAANSYNVYLGTSKSQVEARAVGTLKSTEQAGLTYSPVGGLTSGTTYYWAVDSVGATDLVGNGATWEFTTDGDPPTATKFLLIRKN